MSPSKVKAEVWTCDRCGVSVKQMNGASASLPDSWTSSGEGQFCLICRRALAAEAAIEAVPETTSQEARAKLRRAALLEFEVSRTPDRSNGEIARTCRSSVPAVAKARERLRLPEPS
jgi:hypothetical protein